MALSTTEAAASSTSDLPTLTVTEIANTLAYPDWAVHKGYSWSLPIDLDRNPDQIVYVDYSDLTKDGQWYAKYALEAWTATTGIQFSAANPPSGQSVKISFDDERSGANTSTSATVRGTDYTISKADVNVAQSWLPEDGPAFDSYVFRTFVHELGHALGFEHPTDYGSTPGKGKDFATDAEYANDSWQATVMSYFDQDENPLVKASQANVLTLMPADILAAQMLYGTVGTLRTGNTTYGVGSTAGDFYDHLEEVWQTMAFTIIDDGGIDTLNFSRTAHDQKITLQSGVFSNVGNHIGNMAIAEGTVIENLVSGGGNDRLTGNIGANVISGGAGNDIIDGLDGNDILKGGDGNDTLIGSKGNDKLFGGNDTDTLKGFAGADTLKGERGNDTLLGGTDNDVLYGNAGTDIVKGEGGDDRIFGGTQADKLYGNNGNDTIKGEAGDDKIYGAAGNDALLGGNGNDKLDGGDGTDTLTGGAGKDVLKGGDQNDILNGGIGNDILRGGNGVDRLNGDSGTDTLDGGNGSDVFVFERGGAKDIILDWEDGKDRLDLSDWGLSTFREVAAKVTPTALGLEISLSDTGDLVEIRGLLESQLDPSDLILV